jgi:hypothetical protein
MIIIMSLRVSEANVAISSFTEMKYEIASAKKASQ